MNFELTQGEGFKIIPEGNQILTIKEATAKPSAKPQVVEITLVNEEGASVKQKCDLTLDIGRTVFSIILRTIFGEISNFELNDIGKLVGTVVEVEIKHVIKESTKNPGKTVTFVNIGKWIRVCDNKVESVGDDL